jgi:uncharacterized protein YndB with AHSA1/START domain
VAVRVVGAPLAVEARAQARMAFVVERTVVINAPPSVVWNALVRPDLMQQWMGEPEMHLEIVTEWIVGHPITIRGFHHVRFENRGTVLQIEPNRVLRYSHLSSLSRLPDKPEHYSVVEFRLQAVKDGTALTLTLGNFPTETIRKHLDFYWRTTLEILKKCVEGSPN